MVFDENQKVMIMCKQNKELAELWLKQARKQIKCAEQKETSELGNRVMWHGAWIYFNCANELLAIRKSIESNPINCIDLDPINSMSNENKKQEECLRFAIVEDNNNPEQIEIISLHTNDSMFILTSDIKLLGTSLQNFNQ